MVFPSDGKQMLHDGMIGLEKSSYVFASSLSKGK